MRNDMRRALSSTIALFLFLPALLLAEDVTVHSTVTVGKDTTHSTQVVTEERVRAADGVTESIFEIASGKMTFIDHKKEEFYETSLEEMEAQFAEIDRTLDSNPMMRRMLAGKDQDAVLEKGNQPRTIAGYKCDHYILTMGKGLRMEIWATPDLEAPSTYFEARRLSYAAMGPVGTRFNKMLEEMQKIEGFPLASNVFVKLMGMKSESQSEATEVKIGPVDDSVFDVPAGYKQGKSPFQQQ